jgi:hypothetical protein
MSQPSADDDEIDNDVSDGDHGGVWMPPKQPVWAFALSFFLPGAGLVYLRRPMSGLVNFLVVVFLGTFFYFLLPPAAFKRFAPVIGLCMQFASGVYAQWQAHVQCQADGENEQDPNR